MAEAKAYREYSILKFLNYARDVNSIRFKTIVYQERERRDEVDEGRVSSHFGYLPFLCVSKTKWWLSRYGSEINLSVEEKRDTFEQIFRVDVLRKT